MTAGCSLLLVEDDPELLEILTRALTRRGLSVSGCETRAEALRLAGDRAFQAAVVDGNLGAGVEGDAGQQDGTALVRELKVLQPGLHVLVLSGRADQAARDRAFEAGASAYLCKPCSLADLHDAIAAAVEGRASR